MNTATNFDPENDMDEWLQYVHARSSGFSPNAVLQVVSEEERVKSQEISQLILQRVQDVQHASDIALDQLLKEVQHIDCLEPAKTQIKALVVKIKELKTNVLDSKATLTDTQQQLQQQHAYKEQLREHLSSLQFIAKKALGSSDVNTDRLKDFGEKACDYLAHSKRG